MVKHNPNHDKKEHLPEVNSKFHHWHARRKRKRKHSYNKKDRYQWWKRKKQEQTQSKTKMNIKILSANAGLYSTKRLVEAAQKRKHEVEIINHTKCDIVIEKKNPLVYYKGKPLSDTDAVIPRIGASVTFYGTAVVRQFEMMRVFSTPSLWHWYAHVTSYVVCKFYQEQDWGCRKLSSPTIQKTSKRL